MGCSWVAVFSPKTFAGRRWTWDEGKQAGHCWNILFTWCTYSFWFSSSLPHFVVATSSSARKKRFMAFLLDCPLSVPRCLLDALLPEVTAASWLMSQHLWAQAAMWPRRLPRGSGTAELPAPFFWCPPVLRSLAGRCNKSLQEGDKSPAHAFWYFSGHTWGSDTEFNRSFSAVC